jgi:hypothetical protein
MIYSEEARRAGERMNDFKWHVVKRERPEKSAEKNKDAMWEIAFERFTDSAGITVVPKKPNGPSKK